MSEENKNLSDEEAGIEPNQPAENVPDEIISSEQTVVPETEKQPEPLHIKPLNETMETHADHLHKVPGHGWKHYFFEFFMLFLAVFCGFLVENYREHMIENRREARYMQSLLQDLSKDTAHIQNQLTFQQRAVKFADSLVFIMNSPDRNAHLPETYYYTRILAIMNPFLYSNATITQLKSSGSLRLIKQAFLADSIVQYDVWTQRVLTIDENIANLIRDFRSSIGSVFDATVINNMSDNRSIRNNGSGSFIKMPDQPLSLITDNRQIINQLCIYADFMAALYQSHFNSLTAQKGRAKRLIEIIKKEYHLE